MSIDPHERPITTPALLAQQMPILLYHPPNHPTDQQQQQQTQHFGIVTSWHAYQPNLPQPSPQQLFVPGWPSATNTSVPQESNMSFYQSVGTYYGYTHSNPDLSQQTLDNNPFEYSGGGGGGASTVPRSLSNSTSGISSGIEMANVPGSERGSSYPPLPEAHSLGASPYSGSYYSSGGGYFDSNSGFSSQGESQQ